MRRHERRQRVVDGHDERAAVRERRRIRRAEEKIDVTGCATQSPVKGQSPVAGELVDGKRMTGRQDSGFEAFRREDNDLAEGRVGARPLAQKLRDEIAAAQRHNRERRVAGWDLAGADYAQWFPQGPGLGARPSAAGRTS